MTRSRNKMNATSPGIAKRKRQTIRSLPTLCCKCPPPLPKPKTICSFLSKRRKCITIPGLCLTLLMIVLPVYYHMRQSSHRTDLNDSIAQLIPTSNSQTYTNKFQEEEDDNQPINEIDSLPKFETGSFANCTQDHATSTTQHQLRKTRDSHPDGGTVIISCREIMYRAPLTKIEEGGTPIVVGILSGAGGKGSIHRDSIRSTWARDFGGVYFLVAGPWEEIAEEYASEQDLIWIDEEEVYEGEKSVLPFKTESFLYIIHKHSLPGDAGFQYLFKTDDDSYVDLVRLEDALLSREEGEERHDYWGACTEEYFEPLRDTSLKWHVTYEMYPEQFYPLYCQGAGFAVSRDFVSCAVNEGHLSTFRYNPFEDVSIGFLAERCGVEPVSDYKSIVQYRAYEGKSQMKASTGKQRKIDILPKATMIFKGSNKAVQHRVKTHSDMYAHHKCVLEGC